MPLKCFEEHVILDGPPSKHPKHYLLADDNCPSVFEETFDRLCKAPGWTRRRIATGHDAMITKPKEVADWLMSLI